MINSALITPGFIVYVGLIVVLSSYILKQINLEKNEVVEK